MYVCLIVAYAMQTGLIVLLDKVLITSIDIRYTLFLSVTEKEYNDWETLTTLRNI